jgi:mannose-6-phosphate isomerase-like protein (cupin superfamily)
MKFTVEEMLARLPLPANEKWKEGVWDFEPFKKENVTLVFFAPRGTDYQTFHAENEFYFIAAGSGQLVIEHERFEYRAGDTFFVPALQLHHFEYFTDDFAAWAIFF